LLLPLTALRSGCGSPGASAQRPRFSVQSDALYRTHGLIGFRRVAAEDDGVTILDSSLAPSKVSHGRWRWKELGAPLHDLPLFIFYIKKKGWLATAEIEFRNGSGYRDRSTHLIGARGSLMCT